VFLDQIKGLVQGIFSTGNVSEGSAYVIAARPEYMQIVYAKNLMLDEPYRLSTDAWLFKVKQRHAFIIREPKAICKIASI
jgi:hypothetical protein